jgi:phenylacetate-CoA ligase
MTEQAPMWQRAVSRALRAVDGVASTLMSQPWRDAVAVGMGDGLDKAYGRDVSRLMPGFLAREQMSSSDWAAYRDSATHQLLAHCRDHVPFYRSSLAGYDAHAPALEQLHRLPLLSKDDVREQAAALHATDQTRKVIVARTSGSTGRPLVVEHDLVSAAYTRAAQRRAFQWFGVHPYATRVMLLAMPRDHKTHLKNLLVDIATSRRLVEFYDVSNDKLNVMIDALASHRPTLVTAYASVLHALCLHMIDRGMDGRRFGVKLLHTQSEMLLDSHRESMARAFPGVPVMNEYGSVEVGAMAYSCAHGSLHTSADHVVTEVVDEHGKPVADGQSGRIVFTSMHARAMPLLRYAIGDEGVLSHDSCPCGRFPGQTIIASLDGRVFERIVTQDGRGFSAGMVHFLIRKADLHRHLREFLAIQRQAGALHFLLVPSDTLPDDHLSRLQREAKLLFGDDFVVGCERVEAIVRTKRKKSYFSSELAGA